MTEKAEAINEAWFKYQLGCVGKPLDTNQTAFVAGYLAATESRAPAVPGVVTSVDSYVVPYYTGDEAMSGWHALIEARDADVARRVLDEVVVFWARQPSDSKRPVLDAIDELRAKYAEPDGRKEDT